MPDYNRNHMDSLTVNWLSLANQIESGYFERALVSATNLVHDNLDAFSEKFPSAGGVNGVYQPTNNADPYLSSDWTSSFWSGMVWLTYEVTGDPKAREVGLLHSKSFRKRYEENDILDHHDIGFLFSLSCVAAYKLTGDSFSRETAILAARKLLRQYIESCGVFQSGGSPNDPNNPKRGNCIVDCCMNLPLLYWASTVTGEPEFSEKAYRHIQQAANYMVRDSAAVHQNLKFDADTGKMLQVFTCQGKGGEDACWSRGQAWAIYGFMLSYLYTGDQSLLEISKRCTVYFLNHLQSDYCANWDFFYQDDKSQRDTSAVSIAACGILELAKQLPLEDPDRPIYEAAARVLIYELTRNYRYTREESPNALLKAGVYAYRTNLCVNEPTIWGDYFYMEALTRLTQSHRLYW